MHASSWATEQWEMKIIFYVYKLPSAVSFLGAMIELPLVGGCFAAAGAGRAVCPGAAFQPWRAVTGITGQL